ncbi:hypothetical protein PVK06_017904 [Gossypium arboreum]|uniref:Reverse transcriptase zinc-binding domain-containing protein n=1 Tax=Gossypium arboreum TaxID=29729 RepID=A0ABR0Q4X1_GOSAR|nr:hypothetical protein PVK06_017904 [Gossypium arboreum]
MIEEKWVQEEIEAVLINVFAPTMCSSRELYEGVNRFEKPVYKSMDYRRDFNVVRYRSERSNCMGTEKGSRDFDSFIHNCKLIDLPLLGKKFTWYSPDNRRRRLTRFLLEEFWLIQIKDLHQLGLKIIKAIDRVPTKDFLVKRGEHLQNIMNVCLWCEREQERADHLLFKCRFIVGFWRRIFIWWDVG